MRLNDPATIDTTAIKNHVATGKIVTVQFSKRLYSPAMLAALNALCEELDDHLCIRFYGHYGEAFDCAHLKYLPSVKNLNLDCLNAVENFDTLRQLEHLARLNIGIYTFLETDFLSWPNLARLTSLCIAENQKNNIDLQYLSRYSELDTLFLNAHVKGIESLAALTNARHLSLSIPSRASIKFLNHLPRLLHLRFILGGRQNLDDLENYRIEELEIVRVKGYAEFNNLSEFHNLKKLLIEDQIQIKHLDFGTQLHQLSELTILNCKNLESLAGLAQLRKLSKLTIYKTNIDFDDFVQQQRPESLKTLAFHTAKKTRDAVIKAQLAALGY